MTTRHLWIAGFFFAGACAAGAPGASDLRTRGAAVEGSCSPGACGGQSQDGCWCDEACVFYGDCCQDAGEVCGIDECADDADCADGEVCTEGEPRLCVAADPCAAQDAAGVGLCAQFHGYRWNGAACEGVSGCSCEGADCGALYADLGACEAAHAACGGDACPDPNDPEVDYVSEDPDFCATVKFTCAPGKMPFSDDCGCGCAPDEPAMCGGIAAIPCEGEGEFCDVAGHCGAGDQSGVCRPMPEFCTQEYAPVCGCDGKTYGNACAAHQAGVSVAHDGPCPPKVCGGIAGTPCQPGDFCDFGSQCGAGDQTGTCTPQPEFCTQEYAPVCGCDGKTYGNVCLAHAQAVSVAHLGPCDPPTDTCEGHCGGASEDGTCWCDTLCAFWGDCCADKQDFCG